MQAAACAKCTVSLVVPAVGICCSEREWHTLLLRPQTVAIILKSDIPEIQIELSGLRTK